MSELIAVSNDSFEITIIPDTPPIGVPPAIQVFPNAGIPPYTFGINDVSKTEDSNCKCQGDQILVDELTQKTVLPTPAAADDYGCDVLGGLIASNGSFVNKGSYVIGAGADKVKCSSVAVMLENDETTLVPLTKCACAAAYTISTPPGPIPCVGSCSIKITNAGQAKVKAK